MITSLAKSITKASSKQTYYTIHYLADRTRLENAYRAYAYFRWVDDILDAVGTAGPASIHDPRMDRKAFMQRQKSLLENSLDWELPPEITSEERMLVDLLQSNLRKNSGLRTYIDNMMKVMDFDVERRGRLITQGELNDYTGWLAVAVTECLDYFVGNSSYAPRDETRYLAVSAAHITHMLRDTYIDLDAGYFNIPTEVLDAGHMRVQDVHSPAYRAWVKGRVALARECFEAGKEYFRNVQNGRLRLAVFAYISRFEWILNTIEAEQYILRPSYADRKSLWAGMSMAWSTLLSLVGSRRGRAAVQPVVSRRQGRL